MELKDVIRSRRAIREYSSQPVDRAAIERLIAAAVLAPSAENHQPWRFTVCLNRDRIDELALRAKHHLLSHPEILHVDGAIHHLLVDPQFSILYHAPALIIVLAKAADPQSHEDCCLAAQNILLAARDEQLGTCWIGLARPWLDLPATKSELGIPAEYSVVAPIVVGHPKRWPDSHPRNVPLVHWLE